MIPNIFPMGNVVRCHHGEFLLPSDVHTLEIDDDKVKFYCVDGIFEARQDNNWEVVQLIDHSLWGKTNHE